MSLTLITFLSLLNACIAGPIDGAKAPRSEHVHDVVVVGGGPGGLAASMSLGRVRRDTLMIDSGEYRNAQTLHMHDVIGADGLVPAYFRAKVRDELKKYPTVSWMNGTVQSVTGNDSTGFTVTNKDGQEFQTKKVIFSTGIKEALPKTPGLAEEWGRGFYWCTWCDGWEHQNMTLGKVGKFSIDYLNGTIAGLTLNPDSVMLTNGTMTEEAMQKVSAELPLWREMVADLHIGINNRSIASIGRVHGNTSDLEDPLLVKFTDGTSTTVGVLKATFPAPLSSNLLARVGMKIAPVPSGGEGRAIVNKHMESSVPGLFVVGDANSDESNNVPHALWSAKRAVIGIHETLANNEADGLVAPPNHVKREFEVEHSFEDFELKLKALDLTTTKRRAESLFEFMTA